jgi:hypothetical protein
MGHILFAAPGIDRFHLHDRLARALAGRGHRVSVLSADPVAAAFWSCQGIPAWHARPSGRCTLRLPLVEFAEHEWRRRGVRLPLPAQVDRVTRRIGSLAEPVLRHFELDPPDLLLFHQGRTGMHRMLHSVAREFGCHVLHTGSGLLPGTMQWDLQGIDGDSRICERAAVDYRDGPRDEPLLAAALASWIAGIIPTPLQRTPVLPPTMLHRVRAWLQARRLGEQLGLLQGLRAWWEALEPDTSTTPLVDVPSLPYVAVLLQPPDCPRARLDAADPGGIGLVLAAARATQRVDPALQLVVLAPRARPTAHEERLLRRPLPHLHWHPLDRARQLLPTAMACVTVNHPLAFCALLASTPVLHTGRALYAVPGVATRTTEDTLTDDLLFALGRDQPTLRERFLTRLLTRDHVWCDPIEPDHNGVGGLVAGIEGAMQKLGRGVAPVYRAGPVWPLAVSAPDEESA